jgi:hypothetical protein
MASAKEITLSVEVTDFETTKGAIQISGQATQVSGALATFNQVVDFAKKAKKESDGWFVDVTAKTVPPVEFDPQQEITVFAWVGKAWVTVLGQDPPRAAGTRTAGSGGGPTTKWGQIKGSSQLTNQSWAESRTAQQQAGQQGQEGQQALANQAN